MLRIYQDALALCREAGRVAKEVERFDCDLARQLRRAGTSVPLNIAEGSGSFGGHRRQRYFSALGSAREVVACFDVAEAMGYVASVDARVRELADIVIGTLTNVLRLKT
ncbi:MAG TPA: four helix bundle protein [Polyangiaceae bacterium]